jgi:opacity protein-like surface antigen
VDVGANASNSSGSYAYAGAVSTSGRVISISGNFNYNFPLKNTPIQPYAGAGLTYGMFSGDWIYDVGDEWGTQVGTSVSGNDFAFSLGGGIKYPIQGGRRSLRGDVKIITFPSTAFNLRLGVVF